MFVSQKADDGAWPSPRLRIWSAPGASRRCLNVKRDLKADRDLRRCRIMVVPLRQQLQQSQLAGREVIVGVVLKLLRLLVDEQEKERLEGQAEHLHFCQ